jgi:hypothetical protein
MHHRPLATTVVAVLAGLVSGYICALAGTSMLLSVVSNVHPIIEFVIGYLLWVTVGIAVMLVVRRALRGVAEAGTQSTEPTRRPPSDATTGDGNGPPDNPDTDDRENA